MTRYYYTCPIKAAYMAEYFGVEMSYLFCDADRWQEYKSTERMGAFEIEKYFHESRATLDGRILISEQWNDFFNPKVDDIVDRVDPTPHGNFYKTRQGDVIANKAGNWNLQIIMRDNKQFFMPEVEND